MKTDTGAHVRPPARDERPIIRYGSRLIRVDQNIYDHIAAARRPGESMRATLHRLVVAKLRTGISCAGCGCATSGKDRQANRQGSSCRHMDCLCHEGDEGETD